MLTLGDQRNEAPFMNDTILIIEDDPLMVAFLDEYLSKDFKTVKMTNAAEALQHLDGQGLPALVILDLFMPEMDGFSFLETIRSNPAMNRLPVLVLSGSEKSEDRVRAFELGADDFVVKPFNPMELAARVRNLIRRTSG